MESLKQYRKRGFYEKYVKRGFDIVLSALFLFLFWWVLVIIAIMVRVKLGSPILFKQLRPGMVDEKTGEERIFTLNKFRTMTNEKDENGRLLPDEKRLPAFGKWLRSTSFDELPEIINILFGDMSIIGPRPQLVRDMVFMDQKTRMRHTAKPGLSGLAQVSGRNAITWDEKFDIDLEYIHNVSFINDLKILIRTVLKVFGHNESPEELDVTLDYGDWVLLNKRVSQQEYEQLQNIANMILEKNNI